MQETSATRPSKKNLSYAIDFRDLGPARSQSRRGSGFPNSLPLTQLAPVLYPPHGSHPPMRCLQRPLSYCGRTRPAAESSTGSRSSMRNYIY